MSSPKPPIHNQMQFSDHKKKFEALCLWIDAHNGEPVGWQELMTESGLDHQTINALFRKYKSTTPMAWIRSKREAGLSTPRKALPMLLLPEQSTD